MGSPQAAQTVTPGAPGMGGTEGAGAGSPRPGAVGGGGGGGGGSGGGDWFARAGGGWGGWRGRGGLGAVELEVVDVVHVAGGVAREVAGAGAGPAGRALGIVGHVANSNAFGVTLRTLDLAVYHGVP